MGLGYTSEDLGISSYLDRSLATEWADLSSPSKELTARCKWTCSRSSRPFELNLQSVEVLTPKA